MTVKEMHRQFKISLDKVDSSSLPEFKPSEIDYYLNEACMRFIKTRYGRNNIYHQGFEETQKRTEDLKNIVVTRYTTPTLDTFYTGTNMNIYNVNLSQLYDIVDGVRTLDTSSVYMIFAKCKAKIVNNTCSQWVKCELSQQDDFTSSESDPFNQPTTYKPLVLFEEGNILVNVPQGNSVSDFMITFIKEPNKIYLGTYPLPGVSFTGPVSEVTCNLSNHTHPEIVQLAVTIALENIGSPRVQTQVPINLNNVE